MPAIHPVSAITYATKGDISPQIAPPYDVLDAQPKQKLLDRCDKNIVAIDLPVTPPKTVGPDAAYDQAGQTLREWLSDGTLIQSQTPCLFAYEQVYTVAGETLRRRGLFAAVGLQPFNQRNAEGGIFRHEMTIQGGIDDRYKLMQATAVQLSPVFSIFPDRQAKVAAMLSDQFERSEPDFHGTTPNDNVLHRVWRVTDASTIEKIQQFFHGTDIFIADGHHRYTTALNYFENNATARAAQHGGTCLMVLVAAEDPGMIVLPTHRVICSMTAFSIEQIVSAHEQFTLTEAHNGASDLDALQQNLAAAGAHAMGLIDPPSGRAFVLTTKTDDPLAGILPNKPAVWRQLDVAVLHELLIDRLLRPHFGGEQVRFKYTAELPHMMEMVQSEPSGTALAVVMQHTPLQSVCDVAMADEVMPPKSTFFYPKLATGLVIHSLA